MNINFFLKEIGECHYKGLHGNTSFMAIKIYYLSFESYTNVNYDYDSQSLVQYDRNEIILVTLEFGYQQEVVLSRTCIVPTMVLMVV